MELQMRRACRPIRESTRVLILKAVEELTSRHASRHSEWDRSASHGRMRMQLVGSYRICTLYVHVQDGTPV